MKYVFGALLGAGALVAGMAEASVVHYAYQAPRLKPANLEYLISRGEDYYVREESIFNPFSGTVISIDESYFGSLAGKTVDFSYKAYSNCAATGNGCPIECFMAPFPCEEVEGLVSIRSNSGYGPGFSGSPPFDTSSSLLDNLISGSFSNDGFRLSLTFSDTKEIVAWDFGLVGDIASDCQRGSGGFLSDAGPVGSDTFYCQFGSYFSSPNVFFQSDGPGSWTVIPAPPALLGAVSGMLALWGIGRRRRAARRA